jgi:hypothetical protein
MARAEVAQADVVNEYLEAVAATAEDALDELRRQIATGHLGASHVSDISTPRRPTSQEAMAEARRVAEAALPKDWWIASVLGSIGAPDAAGWFATANGGPTSGYRGRQGMGATPNAALLALGSAGPV